MKTHYELLGLEPGADAEAIKRAFRREIARYHPDKVVHLGPEFQEMAAVRAAELTVAYKTLTDPALRADYDKTVDAAAPPVTDDPVPERQSEPPPPHIDEEPAPPPSNRVRFAAERADRDMILKRAIAGRVLAAVEMLYGKVETPPVRGFDVVMVPVAKPRFLGAPPPRVFVRVVESADTASMSDAYTAASRARLHAGKSPVVVMLFARHIAQQQEISRAHEVNDRQRKAPDGPVEVAVVIIDTADWSCRLPPNASSVVRKLTEQICA